MSENAALIGWILAALAGAVVGAGVGGFVALRTWANSNEDFSNQLEDLDDRLLQWQRKVTKRERDALRGPQTRDLPAAEPGTIEERRRAILDRAARSPLVHGRQQ